MQGSKPCQAYKLLAKNFQNVCIPIVSAIGTPTTCKLTKYLVPKLASILLMSFQ